jgi:hypothetical protein
MARAAILMRDDRGPALHTVSAAFQQSPENRKDGR